MKTAHLQVNSAFSDAGIDSHNVTFQKLLEVAQINVWEWDIVDNGIIDFGSRPSLACERGSQKKGTLAYFFSQVHKDDLSGVMCRIDHALTKPDDPEYYAEFRILKNHTEYEHILARGRVVHDAAGQPVRMFGIWFSIDDLTRKNEVALLQQAAMARFSRVTTIGELASRLAHELTQPPTTSGVYLDGCINRLERGEIEKEELIRVLKKSSHYLHSAGETIHRVKNFIRRGDLVREKTSLRTVLDNAIRLAEMSYGFPVSMIILEQENLPDIKIDRLQIRQVLLNLLNNSFDALNGINIKNPEIVVELKAEDETLQIRIKDNGPGISSAIVNKLFMPFYSTKKDGFGMGLSACRSIVEAHNGQIRGGTLPGGGCCFEIQLPMM